MSLTPLEITLGDINRISVVHRFIKPLIICSQLRNWPTKTFVFSEEKESELEKLTGKRFANAYDYWSEFDEKFFDMGNLMRLTTEFEKGKIDHISKYIYLADFQPRQFFS
jgi:hypothetical protein